MGKAVLGLVCALCGRAGIYVRKRFQTGDVIRSEDAFYFNSHIVPHSGPIQCQWCEGNVRMDIRYFNFTTGEEIDVANWD